MEVPKNANDGRLRNAMMAETLIIERANTPRVRADEFEGVFTYFPRRKPFARLKVTIVASLSQLQNIIGRDL